MEGLAFIEYTDEQFDFEPIEVGTIDYKIFNSNYEADSISGNDIFLLTILLKILKIRLFTE